MYHAGEVSCNATDVAVHTHGGNGLAQGYLFRALASGWTNSNEATDSGKMKNGTDLLLRCCRS